MKLSSRENERYNSEGYKDLTAYEAIQIVAKENEALENKVSFLIRVLKFIAREAGFDIQNRIELKDRHSGRVFK